MIIIKLSSNCYYFLDFKKEDIHYSGILSKATSRKFTTHISYLVTRAANFLNFFFFMVFSICSDRSKKKLININK